MSREKQIEEMAEITKVHCELENQCGSCHWETCNDCFAEIFYNAGYRKQSEKYLVKENGDIEPLNKQTEGIANNATTTGEWISVDERLPTDEQEVLVYYGFDYGDGDLGRMYMSVLTFFAYDPIPHFQHQAIGLKVTHWMPLPEAPKMKGGAE